MSLEVLVGYGGGFFHHVSEIACHCKLALALAHRTLNEEYFSAHFGPGQSSHHSRCLVALLQVVEGHRQTEVFLQVLRLDA